MRIPGIGILSLDQNVHETLGNDLLVLLTPGMALGLRVDNTGKTGLVERKLCIFVFQHYLHLKIVTIH